MKSAFLVTLALFASVVSSAQHEHTAKAAAAPQKSAAVCPVSGEKLGAMGAPVSYTYKEAGKPDRVLQFCCQDCIKDFEKAPAKYLAKLDAGLVAKSAEGCAMACCEGAGEGCEILTSYVPVAEALAADDLPKAKAAAATLAKQADASGLKPVYQQALAVIHANSIATARTSFKALSKEVVPMAENTKGYVVMTCPMANADWIQTDAKVRNPYYGKMMLTCGAPKAAAN